ncbi:unnamed protein product [Heligmosomoides polygyrus]|uniref:SWIM-type domain-containing protein n=1 Tax=Heligmosomoides polygyrus TaxID=6339 RepID=A0A3P7XJS3_HELPZ|nr:unnamed protein product [Heligmosomoides polygyrus]
MVGRQAAIETQMMAPQRRRVFGTSLTSCSSGNTATAPRLPSAAATANLASAMNSLELDDDAFYICTEMSPRCFVVQKVRELPCANLLLFALLSPPTPLLASSPRAR